MAIGLESFDRVTRTLAGIPKQIAYASSRALNDTAREVQEFTVSKLLPEKFTLRSRGAPWFKPGNKFGFNVNFATKTKLEARIGSQADWLRLQEEGGTKSIAGHRLAIPTSAYKPKVALMLARMKPRAILAAQAATLSHRRASDRMVAASQALASIRVRAANAYMALPRSERLRRGGRAAASAARIEAMGFRQERKSAERTLRQATHASRLAATRAQNARTAAGAMLSQGPWTYHGKAMPAGIYVRKGKARLPIMKVFTFEASARISPVLHFVDRGTDLINRTYLPTFNKRLVEALIGAK